MKVRLGSRVQISSLSILLAVVILFSLNTEAKNRGPSSAKKTPSLLKTARTADYSRGLFFDEKEKGVILPPMEFEYDLTQDNGASLMLGDVALNSKTFSFSLMPISKMDPRLDRLFTAEEAARYSLLMRWPAPLFEKGRVEMISRTGRVLWSKEITPLAVTSWEKKLESYRTQLGLGPEVRDGIFATNYVEENLSPSSIPLWNQRDTFRFCLTEVVGRNQGRICSQWYGTQTTGKKIIMGRVRIDPITPRIFIENEVAEPKGLRPVPGTGVLRFFAELLNGETCDFVTAPSEFNLVDISDTPRADAMKIVGYDTRPTGRSIVLNPEQYSSFVKMIGFEATIGDDRKFWTTSMLTAKPYLYFRGVAGGIFKQRLELSQLPSYRARPYVERETPLGTYASTFKIFGRKLPDVEVESKEKYVDVDSADSEEFTWYFQARERGELNISYMDVKYQGKTFRSYYEIYKGYPNELSGRFSGILSSSGIIAIGEVAYNHWFEDIFGWTNYWIARQRWGVSARYFQSFNNIQVDTAGGTAKLEVINADIKYRLTPGLWGRDETFGLIASYQDVTFGKIKAPMIGAGALWARSMPRVFDDWLNLFPFMNYPKWVDTEFIFYPASPRAGIGLQTNFALNFHGKVLWTKSIFGEAGFGLKRYAFSDSALNQKAALNTVYGTVGLGISF